MKSDLWDKLPFAPIYLDHTGYALEIEPQDLVRFYEPLANTIIRRCGSSRREIIAVAGPPGSGKTAFSAILSAVINIISHQELSITVGLDGWHFPNEYLDTHWIQKEEGQILLRQVKGAPETFDTDAVTAFLGQVSFTPDLSFPVYSRETHDPISGAGKINGGHRIIILEGNYWLLDKSPWKSFQKYFDLKIILSAEPATLIEGLRERHLRGGKSAEWVAEHILKIDMPNIDLVLNHSTQADVIIFKKNNRKMNRLIWREGFS